MNNTVELSEIIQLISGRDLIKSQYNSNNIGIPYIMGASNMVNGRLIIERWTNEPSVIGKKNDLIISVKGTVGELLILKEDEVHLSRQVMAMRPKSEAYSVEFIYYYIKFYLDRLKEKAKGMIPGITREDILSAQIVDVDIKTQKKIVEVLDKAQILIDKRKEQIEALDELVKSRFIEMFGDPVKNSNGFKLEKLSDIAESFIGLTYKPDDVCDNGTLVLRSGNIQNSKLVFNDNVRVNTKIREKLFVKENDILMCSRNGSARLVGKVAMIPKLDEEVTFGAFMTIIRSSNYAYLFTYFQLEAFRHQLQSAKTSTINQITKKMLDEIVVPLPPIELQNQFAHFVNQVDKLKSKMETSLKELEDNFNSLMQKAFKGELF